MTVINSPFRHSDAPRNSEIIVLQLLPKANDGTCHWRQTRSTDHSAGNQPLTHHLTFFLSSLFLAAQPHPRSPADLSTVESRSSTLSLGNDEIPTLPRPSPRASAEWQTRKSSSYENARVVLSRARPRPHSLGDCRTSTALGVLCDGHKLTPSCSSFLCRKRKRRSDLTFALVARGLRCDRPLVCSPLLSCPCQSRIRVCLRNAPLGSVPCVRVSACHSHSTEQKWSRPFHRSRHFPSAQLTSCETTTAIV